MSTRNLYAPRENTAKFQDCDVQAKIECKYEGLRKVTCLFRGSKLISRMWM